MSEQFSPLNLVRKAQLSIMQSMMTILVRIASMCLEIGCLMVNVISGLWARYRGKEDGWRECSPLVIEGWIRRHLDGDSMPHYLHCKMARSALSLTEADLAIAAKVTVNDIHDCEKGRADIFIVMKIWNALASMGAKIIPHQGVALSVVVNRRPVANLELVGDLNRTSHEFSLYSRWEGESQILLDGNCLGKLVGNGEAVISSINTNKGIISPMHFPDDKSAIAFLHEVMIAQKLSPSSELNADDLVMRYLQLNNGCKAHIDISIKPVEPSSKGEGRMFSQVEVRLTPSETLSTSLPPDIYSRDALPLQEAKEWLVEASMIACLHQSFNAVNDIPAPERHVVVIDDIELDIDDSQMTDKEKIQAAYQQAILSHLPMTQKTISQLSSLPLSTIRKYWREVKKGARC